MSEYKDFLNMIEIFSYALEIQGRSAESFRRSAKNATSEVARGLFYEIGEDFGKHHENLLMRKQKLLEALSHLRAVEQHGEENSTSLATLGGIETSWTEHGIHGNSNNLTTTRYLICDMLIKEDECQYVSVYNGEKYLFCCEDCQKAFELSPPKYIRD